MTIDMEIKKTQINKEQAEAVAFGEGPLLIVVALGPARLALF